MVYPNGVGDSTNRALSPFFPFWLSHYNNLILCINTEILLHLCFLRRLKASTWLHLEKRGQNICQYASEENNNNNIRLANSSRQAGDENSYWKGRKLGLVHKWRNPVKTQSWLFFCENFTKRWKNFELKNFLMIVIGGKKSEIWAEICNHTLWGSEKNPKMKKANFSMSSASNPCFYWKFKLNSKTLPITITKINKI